MYYCAYFASSALLHVTHALLRMQSTALAQRPSASEDFRPEHADWWRTTVVAAAWPSLLGLGCALGLLLISILW